MITFDLTSLTDHGVWISDDRVFACVALDAGGIREIGYHGKQPPSRHARMLAHEEGALTIMVSADGVAWHRAAFHSVRWLPSLASGDCESPAGRLSYTIAVSGASIVMALFSHSTTPIHLKVLLRGDALCTDVQGRRVWTPYALDGMKVRACCHDSIRLHEWIRNTGPYAGDFLIPEPVRRTIFVTAKRSGTATISDLPPEWRDSDMELYSAATHLLIEAEGIAPAISNGTVVIPGTLRDARDSFGLRISFGSEPPNPGASESAARIAVRQHVRDTRIERDSPRLVVSGFPAIQQFFLSVPGLMESCMDRRTRMPRANAGAYYWIWAWDAMVSATETARWGGERLQRDVASFIHAHRDQGHIPMRWTRALEPLDTPDGASLDFLLAHLCEFIDEGSAQSRLVTGILPSFEDSLHATASQTDARGLFPSLGFYPDLPERFGRTARSAVAMEAASYYCLCRITARIAARRGQHQLMSTAEILAERVREHFLSVFWDEEAGFLSDSIDLDTGAQQQSHPLFTLLCLQSDFGFELIEPRAGDICESIEREFLTDAGIRMVPLHDIHRASESVTDAWYPHWDQYALKLLRRHARPGAVMRWLGAVERALTHLGYCPEFLSMRGFDEGIDDPYALHGAASNLNCVTGWYRALLEGLCGLSFGYDALTLRPMFLPIPEIILTGLRWDNATWKVTIRNERDLPARILLNGQALHTLEIPRGRDHSAENHLEILHG
jgi:hypothetical protein